VTATLHMWFPEPYPAAALGMDLEKAPTLISHQYQLVPKVFEAGRYCGS